MINASRPLDRVAKSLLTPSLWEAWCFLFLLLPIRFPFF